jgi:hypothetical protein
MISSGTLEERLRSFLRVEAGERRIYELIPPPGPAVVVERERQGEANVACRIPEGSLCIQWILKDGLFLFLREQKNADGAFFLGAGQEAFEAHVIECKRTVDQSKWNDINHQMGWTLLRLRALAGVLGVTLSRAVLYTAYRNDKLSPDSSPNPAAMRRTVGAPAEPEEQELNNARRRQLDWMEDDIELRGFSGRFPHKKIELDANGAGAVDLELSA